MAFVEVKNLCYTYPASQAYKCMLDDISFSVDQGELVYILGSSGAGKTTLAQCLLGLRKLQGGSASISGIHVADKEKQLTLRRISGLIFENADQQLLAQLVWEDVAFSATRLSQRPLPVEEQVREALDFVGLTCNANRPQALLREGEKRRLALAGVLVYDPMLIVYDSLGAREQRKERELLNCLIDKLHKQRKTQIVLTNETQEAVKADRVLLMCDGKILADGDPRRILGDGKLLKAAGLDIPLSVQLYHDLIAAGAELSCCPLEMKELVDDLCQ